MTFGQHHQKLTILAVYFLSWIFILNGCSRHMYTVQNEPIVGKMGRSFSLDEVTRAIVQAGGTTRIPWEMQEVKPGFIIGTLKLRQHRAVVNINYSAQDFSITYRDSTLLRYEPPDRIGRHYNQWVRELEENIKANLLRASFQNEIK